MAKQMIEVKVTTSGVLFTPRAVGAVHLSIYHSMREAAEAGASAAASELHEGHGLLPYAHSVWIPGGRSAVVQAGALQASIEPRMVRHSRSGVWMGNAVVIQGARGFEAVRFYGRKINDKFRHMFRGQAAAQAYATSNGGQWANEMAVRLNRAA